MVLLLALLLSVIFRTGEADKTMVQGGDASDSMRVEVSICAGIISRLLTDDDGRSIATGARFG
jgi:hypothetical protein